MKSIFKIMIILAFSAALAGCGQELARLNIASDDRLSVISTIFAPYDIAREITGGYADISMLLPPASESHSFEPTPRDIINIQNCDVFIYVGGESDAWINDILGSIDTSGMKIITLMDCVSTVEEKIVEGMEYKQEDIGAGTEEVEYDEHVWTSPKNAMLIVRKISEALCEADASNASNYRKNTDSYLAELEKLDAEFQNTADNSVRKTIVFADRFPFRYLADAYGLEYFAAFPGCSTETEASAATVKFLIDKINADKIPVVFHIELGNKNMANIVSEATNARILMLHSCHNVSKDDFENGVSYLELMTRNVEALRVALT